MRRLIVLAFVLGLFVSSAHAQATRITAGSTLPTSCATGNIFYKTAPSAGFYTCEANVWTGPYPTAAGTGTVTSIATTSPITGGTITTTGTIACATCATAGATLTSGKLLQGSGGVALASNATTATVTKLTAGTPSAASAGTDYVAPGAITTSGLTMTTARLLGRTTAATGAVEEITVGTGLSLSAGSLTATGGGSWIPVVDGSEPPAFITDGNGNLLLVAYP